MDSNKALRIHPEPGFKPSQTAIEEGAIWITINELPLELYDTQILFRVGNCFGKTIRIDANSLEGLKRRYAKVCVLVHKDTPLPQGIWIGESFHDIYIDNGPWFCGLCQQLGHSPLIVPNKDNNA
ncbi:GMP synthase [glutamine-hydrolyzing] [Bienertia sinuspersici]